MNATAFTAGTILGLIAGVFALAKFGEEIGTYTVVAVSTVVPIIIALANKKKFDYTTLNRVQDLSEAPSPSQVTVN